MPCSVERPDCIDEGNKNYSRTLCQTEILIT